MQRSKLLKRQLPVTTISSPLATTVKPIELSSNAFLSSKASLDPAPYVIAEVKRSNMNGLLQKDLSPSIRNTI